jgi:hypothetical protein
MRYYYHARSAVEKPMFIGMRRPISLFGYHAMTVRRMGLIIRSVMT